MLRRIYILFLVGLICAPCYTYAQSKPKRDTSKDRSVVIAKQKAEAQQKAAARAAENKRKQAAAAEAQRRRKAQTAQVPKVATYLRVNQLTAVSKVVGSYSGSETFTVNTDGKEWSVLYVPTWCKVTKYSNYFVLSFNGNMSHDDRSDWFMVKCDNQEVRVDIKQNGTPLNISSRFNYANLTHNVYGSSTGLSGKQCLKINANVTIEGAKGQKNLVVAFIKDEYNNSIKASSGFSDFGLQSSNDLYVATEITPTSDNAQSYNVTLYLPNNAMRLWKKKNKLRCQLAVYCVKTSSYISGANYTLSFKAKSKKGKVTTKKL